MRRGADDVPEGTADAAVRGAAREAEHLGRLRRDANEGGFTAFVSSFRAVFGPEVRTVWFRSPNGEIGKPLPRGVPFSDPPPKPLGRKGK